MNMCLHYDVAHVLRMHLMSAEALADQEVREEE
jgi:hypothetical protein